MPAQGKQCPRCKLTLPLESFRKDPRYSLGVSSYCIKCSRASVLSRWQKIIKEKDIEGKECLKCHIYKTSDQYNKEKHSLDGLKNWCRQCIGQRNAQHRQKLRLRDHVVLPETAKCYSCGVIKPSSEFDVDSGLFRGIKGECKKCRLIQKSIYCKKHPEYFRLKARENHYQRRYGISVEQKTALWEKQDKKCAVCDRDLPTFSSAQLDHDHSTGENRGILCWKCNSALGNVDDSISRLKKLISYLRKHKCVDKYDEI